MRSQQIEQVIFHGGCHGCTQQQSTGSYQVCKGCQFLNANWDLPDLNNRPPSEADLIRNKLNNEKIINPKFDLIKCVSNVFKLELKR